MSPYAILLSLNLKYNMTVFVDRRCWNNLAKYFSLDRGRERVGVLEDSFCQTDIENMTKDMVRYTGDKEEPNRIEEDLLAMR